MLSHHAATKPYPHATLPHTAHTPCCPHSSTTCAQKDSSLYPPNHAVTIIGWEGDNWIVANQWSEYWGMYGTVLLPMDNDCWAATHQPLVRLDTKLEDVPEFARPITSSNLMHVVAQVVAWSMTKQVPHQQVYSSM